MKTAYRDTVFDAFAGALKSEHTGKRYERAAVGGYVDYCRKRGIACESTIDTEEDRKRGTDFIIENGQDVGDYDIGTLRIDVTHDFKNKDNMPLIWDPTPGDAMRQYARPLQFGIRVANETAGFREPVAVIGVSAGNDEMALILKGLREETMGKASYVLWEANEMIAAYRLMTDPSYESMLQDDIRPDTERLSPNYETELHTYRPSKTYDDAARLGMDLADKILRGTIKESGGKPAGAKKPESEAYRDLKRAQGELDENPAGALAEEAHNDEYGG